MGQGEIQLHFCKHHLLPFFCCGARADDEQEGNDGFMLSRANKKKHIKTHAVSNI